MMRPLGSRQRSWSDQDPKHPTWCVGDIARLRSGGAEVRIEGAWGNEVAYVFVGRSSGGGIVHGQADDLERV